MFATGKVPSAIIERKDSNMARTRRIKADGDAFYHVTSRITGKQFLLKNPKVKKLMLSSLQRAATFSGVNLGSFCIMDDHFHLLIHISALDVKSLPDSVLLERIEALAGKKRADRLHDRWEELSSRGDTLLAEAEKDQWRRRMHDLSAFVKTFKEEFRRAFQKEYDYSGRLWGDRFFSTLIGSAAYLLRCAAYIEMNPVRAGMVTKASKYAWNTAGLVEHGDAFATACRNWLLSFAGVDALGNIVEGVSLQDPTGNAPHHNVWLMKRWPQISKGKILGDVESVTEAIVKYKNKLFSNSLRARIIVDGMFASHGYRISTENNKMKKSA